MVSDIFLSEFRIRNHFMYCLKFPFSVVENIVPLSGNLSEILNFLYPADLSYKTDGYKCLFLLLLDDRI